MSTSRIGASSSPLARQQAEAIRRRASKRAETAAKDATMELEAKNVMELLVAEEIEAQLQHLSAKEYEQVRVPQIMAYALNRLPGLYVTSEKGWRRQWGEGKGKLQGQVKVAVRQGIIAVQRDPLRAMGSIAACPPDAADIALGQLRKLLQNQSLTWHNLVAVIQKLLVEGKMNFPNSLSDWELESALNSVEAEVGSTPKPSHSDDNDFDWDSTPMHQI